MKNTLRYNPPKEWINTKGYNNHWFGLVHACCWLSDHFNKTRELSLLEIGSYKGESTSIFASTGLFNKIYCMDPFEGNEIALDELNDTWDEVKREFFINTRHWDYINHIQDFSYNQVHNYSDEYFDIIYIDASHKYEDVKNDLTMYLPKCKHIIGGHDFQVEHPGVIQAVDEIVGKPDFLGYDGSWFKIIAS